MPARLPLRAAILAALSAAPVLQAATSPGAALDASEFLVNSGFTTGGQFTPRVARDAAGDFVVVWESIGQACAASLCNYDVYAQRYDAAGQPQGSSFLVNTVTTRFQGNPAVAMDAAGDFVVVWQSSYQAGTTSGYDVYARQYNAAGTALQASEFLVNAFTSGDQKSPAVAADAAGDFVVAWQSYGQACTTSCYDIYARQFNSTGSPVQATEFLVENITTLFGQSPSVAMDVAGDFVVAWAAGATTSGLPYDVYARQFTSAGSALQATEFRVNAFTSGTQNAPTVAMDAAGDFVVAWQSQNQVSSTSGYDIYARQFNAGGTALQASEFLVNTITSAGAEFPTVAMDAAGDFLVAWNKINTALSNNQYYDIYARRYNAAGAALDASAFLANTFVDNHSINSQDQSAAAMDAAGDFVIAWQSYEQVSSTSSGDIYARRFEGPESVDLSATLAASPGSVSAGDSFSLTLGVDNKTAATTSFSNAAINAGFGLANGLSASFTLPAGVKFVQGTGSNWSCGSVSGTSLSCSYSGTLAAATTASNLTLSFKAPSSAGKLTFPVSVSANQQQSSSDSSGNSASASVTVKATSSSGGGGSSGGGSSGGSSYGGGGGTFDFLSLVFLGLPFLRRRRPLR